VIRKHLHVVPEPGLHAQRAELLAEGRKLWAGLGAALLEIEVTTDPGELYELHRKGERLATALSIVHDDLAKLTEQLEEQ
jgi:hypothetical protein